jgi:DNA polymerase III epsilon subunit-like protein
VSARQEGWKHEPWLVLDTETTGTDEYARIVELAAVTFQEGEPGVRHAQLIDPGCPIPPEASAVHGIKDADVIGAPRLSVIADKLLDLIAVAPVLVAYNWPFDAAILAREIGARWSEAIAEKVIIDPLVVVKFDQVGKWWKGEGRHKLGNVATRLNDKATAAGKPPAIALPDNLHRASADAVLAGRILWHLRRHLPNDDATAHRLIESERRKQEAEFQAWLKSPKGQAWQAKRDAAEQTPTPPPAAPITEPCGAAPRAAAADIDLF